MKTKTDRSYGVIPVYWNGDSYEILVINQISYRGDRFWVFPKGHPDKGEAPEAAALRELEEETGLGRVELDTENHLDVHYQFTDQGNLIKKTVTYFIGHASDKSVHISEPREVAELRWCSPAAARQLLTHENSRQLLTRAMEILDK